MSKLVENALLRIQRDIWKPWRWFLPPGKVKAHPQKPSKYVPVKYEFGGQAKPMPFDFDDEDKPK